MGGEDRREYIRYGCQSACEISIDGQTYNGYVVDYSDGLGVITEKAPLLKKGVTALIRTINPASEMKGLVAWVKDTGKDVRVGFKRVGNLNGNVKDFILADVLTGIQRGTRTGVLEIVSDSVVKRVYIKNGDMVFADSSFKNDRLGEMLVTEGRITLAQYDEASRRLHETGEKLGKILVDMSCLTPRELYYSVRHQVEEIILSLFTMTEGTFEFKEGTLPTNELITLIISAANIIYRGMKKIRNLTAIQQMCPPIEAVMELSQDPISIFQSIELNKKDKEILYLVSDNYPLKEILTRSPSTNFETLKTIAAFIKVGIVLVKQNKDCSHGISAGELLNEHAKEQPEEFLMRLEELQSKCDSSDYYAFLGIDRQATEEEVRKSYFRMSKQFHPDRHFDFPQYDIKSKLIKVFAYATEANTVLSNPDGRAGYDRIINQESNGNDQQQEGPVSDKSEMIHDIQESDDTAVCENTEAHYELGAAYVEMGIVEDAIEEFEKAAVDPAMKVMSFKAIAACHMELGNSQGAIDTFRKLLSKMTSDNNEYLDVKYELAGIYEQSNEYYNALRTYSEIQALDGGYRDVAWKIESVNNMMSYGKNSSPLWNK